MKKYRKISAFLLAVCLILSGCGKRDPGPVATEPLPLPDDIVFEPVSQTVTAKESTNLRDYPSQGDESHIIYTLKNGETVDRVGVSDSGWSQLEYEGRLCYAVTSFLTMDLNYVAPSTEEVVDDGFDTTFSPVQETVTAKDTVNLRSMPSVTDPASEVLAQLHNGETAECVGVSENGWSKLDFNGVTCYAVSSYLTTDMNYTPPTAPAYQQEDGIETVFEPASGKVTAKDTVNLRALPSVTNPDAVVITQLHNGEIAERLGESDSGWTKLTYNGKTCYAVSSYLTDDLDGTKPTEDPDPDGNGIKTKFRDVNEKVTAKDAVNLRAKPSTTDPDAVVVKKLLNGEIVTRTGINDDLGWSRVEYEGQTLYCVSNYLKLSNLQ